jgi:PKD repeat protein
MSNADSLLTTFAAGNGQNGNMFDLVVKNPVTITGFTINNSTAGSAEVYYKTGSYVGSETSPTNWTNLTTTPITISTSSGPTYFDLPVPISLASGQTHAFYVTMSTGSVSYTNGSSVGSVYASNADIDFLEGIGKSYPFGSTFSPRIWNGIIHYGSVGCSDVRQTLTLGINSDTALAAYSFTVQSNGADVDFDASTSNGKVYDWDFGDGNSGSGMMTSHTYAAAGTYNVCLYVTDTVCNTTDTLCQDVIATIGIEESLLNQTLAVYPNPNNGTFRVEFQVEGLQEVEIRVVSLVGQMMYESKPGNVSGTYREEIDLSNEAAGVYVLQLVTEDGTVSRRVTVRK